jgi:hypothetical protein
MERNKKENEEEKGLIVGKSEVCPCGTTPRETKWSEAQWKKHWFDRGIRLEISLDEPRDKGHLKRIEQLHKETRE